jgi:hypothetical protein
LCVPPRKSRRSSAIAKANFRQRRFRSAFGGLLLSQLLTLYTTPVVYLYLDRLRARWEEGPAERVPQPDRAMVS